MKAWQFPLIALSLLFCSVNSFAETAKPEALPVSTRPHPEVDPVGAHIGAWMLYPSADIIESFDNNIYAINTTRKKSDLITQVAPKLKLDSLNTQRGFDASVSSVHGFYRRNDGENFNDYKATINPFWVLTRALKVKGEVSHERAHEQRSDPDALANNASLEPVVYNRTAAQLGWDYKHGRLGIGLHAQRAYLDFNNGQSIGGQSLINDDRNRFENDATATLSCDLTDQSSVYWALTWLNRDYKRPDFDIATNLYDGPERDSNGYKSVIGIRFPLTHLISLDANIGYRKQNFEDPSYKNIGAGVGMLAFTWMVTPLTTIDIGASRDAYETNQANASGYVQTNVSAKVAHELRRNIILEANGGIGQNKYIGLNRNDDYWTAGVATTYKMNRYLHWRLAYSYEERDSNVTTATYDKQRVVLAAKVQF